MKNAIMIGSVSSVAYLLCYIARNILSVTTPQIMEMTTMDAVFIGLLSTANMWAYAGGQLINGIIGDKMKGKYLVSFGLFCAGACNIFVGTVDSRTVMMIAYCAMGFFLSMLYAPLTKLIAENAPAKYVVNCCLGLTLASLVAVPVAGIIALFFEWDIAFILCGLALMVMGIVFYVSVTFFEKKGIVQYQPRVANQKAGRNLKLLLEREIIRFSFISILTGVVRTSVTFWVPTYLSQRLGYSVAVAATIYTVTTCVRSVAPYIGNLFIYQRLLKKNMKVSLLFAFVGSTVGFLLMFMVKMPLLNIAFLTLALMAESIASNLMWTVYCPSLHDTGMVSGATGYLDFLSYTSAGIANLIFANAITTIGWDKLILVWAALMGAGILVSAPFKKKRFI